MVTIVNSANRVQKAPPPTPPVRVNGVIIRRDAIARELQNHRAPTRGEAWDAAARALVVRELLLQEAQRLGISAEPLSDEAGRRETGEEAMIRALVEREVRTPVADEESCRRYYEQNPRRFCSPRIFEVSHILLAAAPDDPEGRAGARQRAEAVIAALRRAPERFAAVAMASSDCPSRAVDGNLGQVGPGQTVPEFEAALASMPVGRVHDVAVESRYGFHVVKVHRWSPERQLPFDLVRARIAAFLEERVRHAAIHQYLAMLAGRAVIEGIDLGSAPVSMR